MSPEEINPQYLLYTQENPTQYQNVNALNVSSVANTNFKANRRTFFVAHGFTDSGKSYYVVDICKALLEKSDINCFCIDYENGAAPPYTRAVNNIRVVGELVAKFIRYLNKTYNHSMSDIYMIGHSLGGQLAGEIGKRLNGLVAMISVPWQHWCLAIVNPEDTCLLGVLNHQSPELA
ncbi:pancreatic lipase-related protein 2-like [Gastrophryne carolinensis]